MYLAVLLDRKEEISKPHPSHPLSVFPSQLVHLSISLALDSSDSATRIGKTAEAKAEQIQISAEQKPQRSGS